MHVKKFFFFILVLFSASAAFAQQEDSVAIAIDTLTQDEEYEEKEFAGSNDTTQVPKKDFDEAKVQQLKQDPDLNYKQPPTVAENLWTRFWAWIAEMLSGLFENVTGINLGRFILIVFGLVLVVAIIMLVLKVDAFRVFYSGADQGKVNAGVFHENIHEMDFEKLIREATDKGEYRLGVRLVFLYALKTLSDKHLIEWHAGKTNHDYVDELKVAELKTGLNELSFYFDYAWYGGFTISHEVFQKVDVIFKSLKEKVN